MRYNTSLLRTNTNLIKKYKMLQGSIENIVIFSGLITRIVKNFYSRSKSASARSRITATRSKIFPTLHLFPPPSIYYLLTTTLLQYICIYSWHNGTIGPCISFMEVVGQIVQTKVCLNFHFLLTLIFHDILSCVWQNLITKFLIYIG